MCNEDLELEMLKLKKLAELQRKLISTKKKTERKDPMEILNKVLIGRAKEVLEIAKEHYPIATKRIIEALAKFVEEGKLKGPINGYDLYNLFLDLGLPIRMPIRIYYEKKGERKPLSDLFKSA